MKGVYGYETIQDPLLGVELQQGVEYTLVEHVRLVGPAELAQIGLPAF